MLVESLDNKRYVVKALKNIWSDQEANEEARFLLNLNHDNIIKMFEYRNMGKKQLSDG